MPAYWVARSRIIDPAAYKKYTDRIPAIFAKYGGRVLARGGRFQIMEGPEKFHRFVVVEFDTFEQGVACFQSPEYEEAAAFRRNGAGEVETIVVEGGDATPPSALGATLVVAPVRSRRDRTRLRALARKTVRPQGSPLQHR
jgi:uncharacterized protein (DUF1330 family)